MGQPHTAHVEGPRGGIDLAKGSRILYLCSVLKRIATLRSNLARRFPDALPRPDLPANPLRGGSVVRFGIPEVDGLLPRGGLARGRLAEVAGPIGSGRTSLVRSLVREAKQPVAIVDVVASLAASDWVVEDDVWVVRGDGPYSADVLLRSRAFGLVIVFDTADRRTSPIVRLQRLAEEAGAVCLFVSDTPRGSSLVQTRLGVTGSEFLTAGIPEVVVGRRVTVRLEKGGPPRSVEVVLHEEEADRLRAHTEAPDRAAVAWRGAGGRTQAPRFAGR